MKNKIFTNTDENKFAREVLPVGKWGSGLFLVKGSIKLDDTHLSLPDETFLVIRSVGRDDIDHSLVICSQGAFFDDVKVWSEDQIPARKPIILTPDTTEVDEETYQKLLSDDVDVIFKNQDEDANLCLLTYKYDDGDAWSFTFTCFSRDGESLSETYLLGYEVRITKTGNPHLCEVIDNSPENQFSQILINEGFIRGYDLSPVLQEIDFTGTDAERKAKLDKFEADWKALTGADDLKGARFVGYYSGESGDSGNNETVLSAIMVYDPNEGRYKGFTIDDSGIIRIANVDSDGNFGTYNLFCSVAAFLKPLTIKTGSATSDIVANKTEIENYIGHLVYLGLDTANGYQVPVVVISDGEEYTGTLNKGTGTLLMGIVTDVNETHHYPFHIDVETGIVTFDKTNYFLEKTSNEVTEMLDAIKYSYTQVPLTTTTSTNKTQLDLFLSKVPNAQVMHCTYKDVYAGTLHKINGSWYGVLVGESNTLAGQLSIKLQADGTIVEGTA